MKKIGETRIETRHRAICHCGAVELELHLPNGIVQPRRCNCSICRRKGTIVASIPLSGLKVTRGEDQLTLYQFNTHTARHYFCRVCGIYTHHQRRSNPEEYGFNVGCLEGVDPFELEPVPVSDGIHHPSDIKSRGHRDAVLEYLDSFCSGDLDRLESVLHPDLSLEGPLFRFTSREDYMRSLREDGVEPAGFEIESIVEEDEAVCVQYRYQKPSGTVDVDQSFWFDGGLITKTRLAFDDTSFTRD